MFKLVLRHLVIAESTEVTKASWSLVRRTWEPAEGAPWSELVTTMMMETHQTHLYTPGAHRDSQVQGALPWAPLESVSY